MKPLATIILLVLLATGVHSSTLDDPTEKKSSQISAPVTYKDLMLVVTDSDGIAAFVFGEKIENGVKYKFRYHSTTTPKEETGSDAVFLKLVPIENSGQFKINGKPLDPTKTQLFDSTGSKLFLRAGKFTLSWSDRTQDSGWIYYEPEKTRVQIGNAEDFSTIDLKRFAWEWR